MRADFWRGRKVFVTGHTGFKGSWLSIWLQALGAELTGYALPPPTDPSLFELAHVADGMTSHEDDVRDLESLRRAILAAQPEIILHLAAQPLVRYSYENPVETYAVNVMGTVHVLESVRACSSVRAVVAVTSDKCYENREWVWGYRETDPMGGYDPYSSSKGCAELVTSAYRSAFFNATTLAHQRVSVCSARAGNVIGGGDWAEDRLIPDMIRAFAERRPVVIRNPHAIRPWQHVLEPLEGYLCLAEKLYEEGPGWAESWNFGPSEDDARTVVWIVRRITALWGEGATWLEDTDEHPHEAGYLKLDVSKARHRLGWRPRWGLDQALRATVDWYRAYRRGEDMRRVSIQQISSFQACATTGGDSLP